MELSGQALLGFLDKGPREVSGDSEVYGEKITRLNFDSDFQSRVASTSFSFAGFTFRGVRVEIDSRGFNEIEFDFTGSEWVDCEFIYRVKSGSSLNFDGHFYSSKIDLLIVPHLENLRISSRVSDCSVSISSRARVDELEFNGALFTNLKSFEFLDDMVISRILMRNTVLSTEQYFERILLDCASFQSFDSILALNFKISSTVSEFIAVNTSFYRKYSIPQKFIDLSKLYFSNVVLSDDLVIDEGLGPNSDVYIDSVSVDGEISIIIPEEGVKSLHISSVVNSNLLLFKNGITVREDARLIDVECPVEICGEFSAGNAIFIENLKISEGERSVFGSQLKSALFEFSSPVINGRLVLPGMVNSKCIEMSGVSIGSDGVFQGSGSYSSDQGIYIEFNEVDRRAVLDFRRSTFDKSVTVEFVNSSQLAFSSFDFSESIFTDLYIENVKLNCIPNFIGATFKDKPVIGKIYSSRFYDDRVDIDVYSESGEIDKNAYLKALTMKNLAEENKDHHKVLAYHGAEMRARRFNTMSCPASIFDFLFSIMSNYGQSIGRPIILLAAVFIIFFSAYWSFLSQSGSACGVHEVLVYTASSPMSFIPDAKEANKNFVNLCVLNGADISLDVKDKIFGFYTLSKLQGFLSVVCLFLLFLALRNRFRIG